MTYHISYILKIWLRRGHWTTPYVGNFVSKNILTLRNSNEGIYQRKATLFLHTFTWTQRASTHYNIIIYNFTLLIYFHDYTLCFQMLLTFFKWNLRLDSTYAPATVKNITSVFYGSKQFYCWFIPINFILFWFTISDPFLHVNTALRAQIVVYFEKTWNFLISK